MIIEHIDSRLPGAILDRHAFRGDQTIVVPVAKFQEVIDLVFQEGFQLLLDVTAVDWFQRDPRFDVVYHLLNLANQERLRLKVRVNDQEPLPSLVPRYRSADWFEREVFDMFGIPFLGHPRLERLLMWRDFPGHPLRKDFPLDGGDSFCGDVGASFAGHAKTLND
jgi:NADH-quinone oxidoreductase subunit C